MSTAATTEREQLGPMHPTWQGYLTLANAEAVRDRMVRDFGDKHFTTAVANGYFGFQPEVWSSCRFDANGWTDRKPEAIRLGRSTLDDGEMAHILWSAGAYSWGIYSTAADQRAAQEQDEKRRVLLTFDHRHGSAQLIIDQHTPAGDRLFWVLSVEDHTEVSP